MNPIIPIYMLAALDLATIWSWVLTILAVVFTLVIVVFVHELGHYLVARACGVKIEKFMVGIDIGGLKLSRRWGETIYGIGILPLGGYVKFMGQDDDPAHIAEQMQKSQIDPGSANAKAVTGPDGETYYIDRRSYLAKSVPQRMAIISAGVVMNIIFAFVFAVIAYGMGVRYMPTIISETIPGSPAWQAALEPGDEIIQIANRKNPTFTQLSSGVTLGDIQQGIPCVVRRAADGEVKTIPLTPSHETGRLAKIGVINPQSLTLRNEMPVIPDSPAANAKLVSPSPDAIQSAGDQPSKRSDVSPAKLHGGDKIVRVGTNSVENYRQFVAELAKFPDMALFVTVERPAKKPAESPETGATVQLPKPQELTFQVEPQLLRDFPLIMEMGPITAVKTGSPAAIAGLMAGDVIEQVDGRTNGEVSDGDGAWTPVTLPEYLRKAAAAVRTVALKIRRASDGHVETRDFNIAPVLPAEIHSDIPLGAPLAADALGIAYRIENQVHLVQLDPAAPAIDVLPGDRITTAKITVPPDGTGNTPKTEPIPLSAEKDNWPALVDALQIAPRGIQVTLTVERESSAPHTVTLSPRPVDGCYVAQRGFIFEPILRLRKATTFAEAIRYGWDETTESLTMVVRVLRKLGGQVPITALAGPVGIAKAAGQSASEGLPALLIFLTMFSANLAVLNFLPIPVLDGGHMVFLAYEGLRGRPASERFVIALHTAGFVFIVGLTLFLLALDFGLVPRNL